MMDLWLPPLVALLIWWLGTGFVMLLDGLPRDTFRFSLGVSTLMALAALLCIQRSAGNTGASGAYAAFTCAVLVWGWHELALLTGWLTGPRREACSAPADQGTRFRQAVQVILWHELAMLATGILLLVLTWGAPNQVAPLTFWLLWVMRLSAKLNLFFGVRNRGEEFLPAHLRYFGSYFRQQRWNALMPWSLLGGTAVALALVGAALSSGGAARTGWLLLASMGTLAVIEHVLLIAPLPPTWLWRWALRPSPP